MSLDVAFNELSGVAESEAGNACFAEACRVAERFLSLLWALEETGPPVMIHVHGGLWAWSLAPGWPVQRWAAAPELHTTGQGKDMARRWKSLATRAREIGTDWGAEACLYGGLAAYGLSFACEHDCLAVSLLTGAQWDTTHLQVSSADGAAVEVCHASRAEHLVVHADWLATADSPPRTWDEMWRTRGERYPNLVFCEDFRKRIARERLSDCGSLVRQTAKCLAALDVCAGRWVAGPFPDDQLACKASLETDRTLQEYGEQRGVTLPHGECVVLSWHLKLAGGYRLYFLPEGPGRQIIVGFVDVHQDTATG